MRDLDVKILSELSQNSRMTWSELSSRMGVFRITAQNRVRWLEDKKIIKKYTILIDDKSQPLSVLSKAFYQIKFARGGSVFQLRKLILDHPGILHIWGVSGDWDCYILVQGKDLNEIALLREKIFGLVNIERMETRPVLNDFD